jgi:hypothetical protein
MRVFDPRNHALNEDMRNNTVGKSFKDNGSFRNRVRGNGGDAGYMEPESSYRPPQQDRAPLQWQERETLTAGQVTVAISSAQGGRGDKLYSFVLGRLGKEPGRTSKFFQPRDTTDIATLMEKVGLWIEADRSGKSAEA